MRRSREQAHVQAGAPRLVVDPVACDGIGICAHLAPNLVVLDTWGFPITPDPPLQHADLRSARAAVAGCPRHALILLT